MIRRGWFTWWERLRDRRSATRPRPYHRLAVEQLGPRWLPAATGLFPAALPPAAVAQGDLNFDGYSDLVTTDYGAGAVSVRLGRGDGTFQDPTTYPIGAGPSAVVLGDANWDGRLDVIVTNSLDGTVGVLLGLGDGRLTDQITFHVGTTPWALATGELNGDGFTDAVVADPTDGAVTVLLNRRSAAPTQLRLAAGDGPVAVALADLNGDGALDAVVADSLSHDVTVLLGRGDGTFRTAPAVPVGAAPAAIATGDVNGDGRADVVTANRDDGSVAVLLGRGDGTFSAPVRTAAGTAPASVAIGDFDGDGRADLAVTGHSSGAVAVLRGLGDGTFATGSAVLAGRDPLAVAAGDFNDDGRLDLAAAGASAEAAVALGLGTGEFVEPGANVPASQPPLVADFNGDGIPDVVSLRNDGVILFRAGRADGAVAFDPPVELNSARTAVRSLTAGTSYGTRTLFTVGARDNEDAVYGWVGGRFVRFYSDQLKFIPSAVLSDDMNGDGLPDLIVASAMTGDVFIGLQRPPGTPPATEWDYRVRAAASFTGLTLTDVNADGRLDLVYTEPNAGAVGALLNDATDPFRTRLRFRAGGPRDVPIAVVAGDFDGDAVTDLAVLDRGTRRVTILRGDGLGGVLAPEQGTSLETGADPVGLVTGDFNLDGRTDLAVLNRDPAEVSVFVQSDRGGLVERPSRDAVGQPARPGAGANPVGIAVRDLNGDGRPDLLIGGHEGDVLALMGNGDGTFRPYQRLDSHVALALFNQNRDGAFELALADRGADLVTLFDDGGARVFQQDRTAVQNPESVAFADLNDDGVADLIVTSGAGNSVLVYPGLREAEFGTPQRFFVGTDPEGITVGDLNADGLPDLVIANAGSEDLSVLFGRGRGADWTLTAGPRLRIGAGPTDAVVRDVTGDGIADLLVANGGSNTVSLLPGVGLGFFDDRQPMTFSTGAHPVQLFVGNFDSRPGLDLVTVNAGSNDLTLFSGLGAARTIPAAGAGLVRAVAGDFTGAGALELIAASEDGRFTLFQGAADGLGATEVAATGLTQLSDMELASADGGRVQVYVTLNGRNLAVPVTLALNFAGRNGPVNDPGAADPGNGADGSNSAPTAPPWGDGGTTAAQNAPAATPVPVTEFSANSGTPLELLATLVPGADAAALSESDQSPLQVAPLSTQPEWYVCGEAVEVADPEPALVEDVAADPVARDRNSLIAGAADVPLLECLDRDRPTEGRVGVPFPSPLEVFEAGGREAPTAPDRVPDAPAETAETPPGAAEAPTQTDGEPEGGSALEWWLKRGGFWAAVLSPVLIYTVLGGVRQGRPKPTFSALGVRGIEGDRHA